MTTQNIRTGYGAVLPGFWHRYWPYIVVTFIFAASRLFYHYRFDIQFDHSPPYYFRQYINPWFIKHDFLRSILYLHQQAPLQNLLTGGCMRVFGVPFGFAVLNTIYIALGLVTALCMINAMLQLGAARLLATVAVCLFAASPVTVFYESWLFYHMPVTALLMLTLVAQLRFYRVGTWGAALLFFSLFGTVSLFYAMFTPLLLVVIALILLLRPPSLDGPCTSPRTRIIGALLVPLILLSINLEKTHFLIGHSQSSAFMWENLAVKTFDAIQPTERQRLEQQGRISRASEFVLYTTPLAQYGELR